MEHDCHVELTRKEASVKDSNEAHIVVAAGEDVHLHYRAQVISQKEII